jgi:hypothetical protein
MTHIEQRLMTTRCTLPKLIEMTERARIEFTDHVCPVHRVHLVRNYKVVDADTILPSL